MTNAVQWDTELDEEAYERNSQELLTLKANKTLLEKRESEIKKTLMGMLEKFGLPYGSDGQHLEIPFSIPIRGYARMVRQARTTFSVDETKAEALARQKGIYDRLFKMKPVLDQDAVMVAVAEGIISDPELEEIFIKRTVFALVPEKEK